MTERPLPRQALADRHPPASQSAASQPPASQPPASQPAVTATAVVPAATGMRQAGRRLAGLLGPGDLVVLAGPLGAGKTTLVQGIGVGLDVRGPITSPTFVIARVHPSLRGGPDLVHADAYRLGSRLEVDDLDLDADLDRCVTVVEWGEGLVEFLAPAHLLITIGWAGPRSRSVLDQPADEPRVLTAVGFGDRWSAQADRFSAALGER